MQADHAEDLASIRAQAQRLLADVATPEHLKSLLEEPGSFDTLLWQHAAEQGWAGVAVVEEYGGVGLGWGGLALICEELGRANASVPILANSLAAHALIMAKSDDARLAGLVEGSHIACLALADPDDAGLGSTLQLVHSRLSGECAPSAFAANAQLALVQADGTDGPGLYQVNLDQPGVQREPRQTFDNARATATLRLDNVEATRLGDYHLLAEISALGALHTAFEQIGGAQACLDMACNYARERHAFGQLIGGFQGIKHKLAEIYCLLEIARGCAADALDAWEQRRDDRHSLAACARLAATRAYSQAAQENLHVHGGMGVTWEAMPHHYYRRSRSLALELGGLPYWRERLLGDLGISSATVLAG